MKFYKIFNRDFHDIHHAAFWLVFFGISADMLGLFRDRILASVFGASRELDIYYSAFRVPDFLYTILLLFTASTAIMPIFLKKYDDKKTAAEEFLGSIILLFSLAIVVLGTIAFFAMPWISRISLPGFSDYDIEKTILLSRILLLSPLFLGLSNIFSSVTQSFRRFFAYGLSPVFYNIGIILGASVFYKFWGLAGLSWGVALGAFLHMAVQIPSLIDLGIYAKIKRFWDEDLRRLTVLSLPRTLGLQITQLTTLILTGIASTFNQGSIAVFNLASNLEYIPVTLIGLSYSVAAFPNLVRLSAGKAKEDFGRHFAAAFRHIVFWTLPFSVLILVLRAQIVRVVLGGGVFSWPDTRLTAAALSILCFAITFQSLFMLLVRTLYADGEAWRPFIINVVSSVLAVGASFWFAGALASGGTLNHFFSSALRISDIADIRVIALPLGILVGSLFNFVFLFVSLVAIFGKRSIDGIGASFLKSLAGSAVGGLAAYWGLNIFANVFDLHTFLGVFLQGLSAGIVGISAIIATLWILGSREMFELFESVKDLFSEKEKGREDMVPSPEPEKLL